MNISRGRGKEVHSSMRSSLRRRQVRVREVHQQKTSYRSKILINDTPCIHTPSGSSQKQVEWVFTFKQYLTRRLVKLIRTGFGDRVTTGVSLTVNVQREGIKRWSTNIHSKLWSITVLIISLRVKSVSLVFHGYYRFITNHD